MSKKIVPKHEPEVSRARGRPSGYRKEYAEQAVHLCRLGATNDDLAIAFTTSTRAIERWTAKHLDFRRALKVGKGEADERVKRSLFSRAVGFTYESVKVFMPAGAKKPVYAPIVERVLPDPTAAIFWLKNRDPARWRDAWQVEHTLGKYLISDKPMTEDEWAKERATLIDVTPEEDKS
jgi:hypothetical protein